MDAGEGQLALSLREDKRVLVYEKYNARYMKPADFPETPTFAVMDVSFISIRKILPALRQILGDEGRLISLIKPQFEAGREALGKRGVVSSAAVHERVLREVATFAPECGWRVRALDFSPISGTQGNLEFLADFIPDDGRQPLPDPREIRDLVKRAHEIIRKNK